MPNLVITLTSVRLTQDTKSRVSIVEAGGVVVGGEFTYRTSAGLYLRAMSNGTAEEAEAIAFALTGAASPGQYIAILQGKCTFNPGAPLVRGVTYILSPTSGKFIPIDEWNTLNFKTHAAIAVSTTEWDFDPQPSGVVG